MSYLFPSLSVGGGGGDAPLPTVTDIFGTTSDLGGGLRRWPATAAMAQIGGAVVNPRGVRFKFTAQAVLSPSFGIQFGIIESYDPGVSIRGFGVRVKNTSFDVYRISGDPSAPTRTAISSSASYVGQNFDSIGQAGFVEIDWAPTDTPSSRLAIFARVRRAGERGEYAYATANSAHYAQDYRPGLGTSAVGMYVVTDANQNVDVDLAGCEILSWGDD